MNKRHHSIADLFLLIDEQRQEIVELQKENAKLREELQELLKESEVEK